MIYTVLPQKRTKPHGAIYTVIKLERSAAEVNEGNSQVNIAEMSISVTSIVELI